MSYNQKRILGTWLLLILGVVLIAMQLVKYWNGTLKLELEELIVTTVATTLVISPRLILESIEKFIGSKVKKE